jgi:AAA+ superfamily predicted ATPase
MLYEKPTLSPRAMRKFQKFYDNIKAIEEEFLDDKEERYNKYLEYFKKDQKIKLKRCESTDLLLFLMEKYIGYKYDLHYALPVISIEGVMTEFKMEEKESLKVKNVYNKMRKSQVAKKGYVVIPNTWDSDAWVATLGLFFFIDIMDIYEYGDYYVKLSKDRYGSSYTHNSSCVSVDPTKDPKWLWKGSHDTWSALKVEILNSYKKVTRQRYAKENRLPQPEIGRVLIPSKDLKDVILSEADAKCVEESIIFIKSAEKARSWGVEISPRILISGIVGTGKTLTAEAICTQLDRQMYLVGAEHIVGRYLGETAQNVEEMFRYANYHSGKIVLVIDEIDGLIPDRGTLSGSASDELVRAVNTFLSNMESYPDIILVGTTNRPNMIDEAAMSRFALNIWFKHPKKSVLEQIFVLHFKHFPQFFDIELSSFLSRMENEKFTGRNVRDLSVACAMIMLSSNEEKLTTQILSKALDRVIDSIKNSKKSIYDSPDDDKENIPSYD